MNFGVSPCNMAFSRALDALVAAAIAIAVSLIAVVAGHPQLLSYFVIASAVLIGICALLRSKPFFLSGSCLALCTANFVYFVTEGSTTDTNSSGFVVLFAVISTGCGLLGAVIAALLLRRYVSAGPILSLLVGFAGVSVGFFSSQLIICNSVMWCGSLSFPIK